MRLRHLLFLNVITPLQALAADSVTPTTPKRTDSKTLTDRGGADDGNSSPTGLVMLNIHNLGGRRQRRQFSDNPIFGAGIGQHRGRFVADTGDPAQTFARAA